MKNIIGNISNSGSQQFLSEKKKNNVHDMAVTLWPKI